MHLDTFVSVDAINVAWVQAGRDLPWSQKRFWQMLSMKRNAVLQLQLARLFKDRARQKLAANAVN
jgi:hypothetical protein